MMGSLDMKSPGRERWGSRVGKTEGAAGGLPTGLPGPLPPGAPGSPEHGRGGHLGKVSWKDASELFAGINQVSEPHQSIAAPCPLGSPLLRGAPASHVFGSWGRGAAGGSGWPSRPGAGLPLTVARVRPRPAAKQQRASPRAGGSAALLPPLPRRRARDPGQIQAGF